MICPNYNLYTENIISVKTGSYLSNWRPINQGVSPGCRLYPLLFNISMNSLLSKLKQSNHECTKIIQNLHLFVLAVLMMWYCLQIQKMVYKDLYSNFKKYQKS